MQVATQSLMTIEEFEQFCALPENRQRRLELVYGEVRETMPTEKHGILALLIGMLLMQFVTPRKLGYVSVETRYRKKDDRHNARLPDVSFRRLTSAVVEEGAVLHLPDLAVEIQSPDDSPRAMREDAAYYLQNGTTLVWLVYPAQQIVEVCTRNLNGTIEIARVGSEGVLEGGTVLPEFTLPLADFFQHEVFTWYQDAEQA
jgi:Uma2 family endonuclease